LTGPAMFVQALAFEKKWGLNFWDDKAAWASHANLIVGTADQPKLLIPGKTNFPYFAMDQRLKFSYLLEHYEQMGGKVVIKDIALNDLDAIAKENDLTLVAGGRGEINQIFPRDDQRSVFDKPQRSLAAFLVNGMVPEENPSIRFNIVPGVGEYIAWPTLNYYGERCAQMLFEGVVGGPFDVFKAGADPNEQLELGKQLLKTLVPHEAERFKNVKLIDTKSSLNGRFAPTVRKPVAVMPCGKPVFGIGDTVVINDPIGGQGANNATKAAEIYLKNILERGDKPFDEAWMYKTFEQFWESAAKYSTRFCQLLLTPPPPHVIEFLIAASKNPLAGDKIAQGFEDPNSWFPWMLTPEGTKGMAESLDSAYEKTGKKSPAE